MAITSTQAVLQEDVVSLLVQEVLTASAVMPGSVMDFTSLVGPGMDRLSIPRFGNLTVTKKTPGSPLTAVTSAFSQDELILDQEAAILFEIERRSELQSKISIANSYIEQGARDMAATVDLDIITALNGSATAASLATPGVLAKADVLEARRLMNAAKIQQSERFCLIHPDEEKDLLNISEYTRVDEAGSSMALRNGEIGKLYGFTFLMSPQQTAGSVSFYHKSAVAHARQKELAMDQDKSLENVSDKWLIDMIYGQKHLDSGARAFIFT